MSAPKARLWPATAEDMHSRELVSMLAAADEALHQLVGDVVVLGQQLAGHVEGHGIGAVARDRLGEAAGHRIQRLVPGDTAAADLRVQQPPFGRQRLCQRRALGAQPPAVGRMLRVAAN